MLVWIKKHKKIIAAIGAAVAAGAGALGYAMPEQVQRVWTALMGVM